MLTLLVIALFGVADYVTGRDFFSRAKLPGRSIWYVCPALTFALSPAGHGLWVIAIFWALWRSVLGWSTFGGGIAPHTPEQTARLFARNVVSAIPVAAAFHYAGGAPWFAACVWPLIFTIYATGINVINGIEASKGVDFDPTVDALHGVVFGMAACAALGI